MRRIWFNVQHLRLTSWSFQRGISNFWSVWLDMVIADISMLLKSMGYVMSCFLGWIDQSWECWLHIWFLCVGGISTRRSWSWDLIRGRNDWWKCMIKMNAMRWREITANRTGSIFKSIWSSRRLNMSYWKGWTWKWVWFIRNMFRRWKQYV